jgi:uncharacterized protein (TIGR03067 family)
MKSIVVTLLPIVVLFSLFGSGDELLATRASEPGAKAKKENEPKGDAEPKLAERKKLQEEIAARDLKKLQGKWIVVARHTSGQKGTPLLETVAKQPNGKFKVVKIQHFFDFKDSTFNGAAFTMDVSRRPKLLTYETVNAVNEKVTRHYIYSFDDDHLLLAESALDIYQGPPADFSGFIQLLRLERVK